MTTGTQELREPWLPADALWPQVRPIKSVAVAVRTGDGEDVWFHAVDGEDSTKRWSGTVKAATPEAALLDVFVRIRSDVDSRDRIRFLVTMPRKSPLWVHQEELRSALPLCTVEGPGPRDRELMSAAADGLPVAPMTTPQTGADYRALPPLTVAADGSVRGRFCGYGWLASDGQYGLHGRIDSPRVIGRRKSMVAELRAIDAAVRRLTGRHLTVFCDNSYAVSMARKWMDGQEILPDGYRTERADGRTAGLVRAQRQLYQNRARLDIRWTRSHRGEPLNEGADALARLASRYIKGNSELSPPQYEQRAGGLADAFATAFRRLETS